MESFMERIKSAIVGDEQRRMLLRGLTEGGVLARIFVQNRVTEEQIRYYLENKGTNALTELFIQCGFSPFEAPLLTDVLFDLVHSTALPSTAATPSSSTTSTPSRDKSKEALRPNPNTRSNPIPIPINADSKPPPPKPEPVRKHVASPKADAPPPPSPPKTNIKPNPPPPSPPKTNPNSNPTPNPKPKPPKRNVKADESIELVSDGEQATDKTPNKADNGNDSMLLEGDKVPQEEEQEEEEEGEDGDGEQVRVREEVEEEGEGEGVVEEQEEEDYVLPTKKSKKTKSKGERKEGSTTKTKHAGGPKVSQSMKKEIMSMAWAAIHQNEWKQRTMTPWELVHLCRVSPSYTKLCEMDAFKTDEQAEDVIISVLDNAIKAQRSKAFFEKVDDAYALSKHGKSECQKWIDKEKKLFETDNIHFALCFFCGQGDPEAETKCSKGGCKNETHAPCAGIEEGDDWVCPKCLARDEKSTSDGGQKRTHAAINIDLDEEGNNNGGDGEEASDERPKKKKKKE